uniref:Uncharacterized protein n=1 Tax=Arundo donax TaxID=35708 RepID=A0A0A9BMP0_ARUDO
MCSQYLDLPFYSQNHSSIFLVRIKHIIHLHISDSFSEDAPKTSGVR